MLSCWQNSTLFPLEQINKSPGIWHVTNDLENAFFSVTVNKVSRSSFAFIWWCHQYTFTVLPLGYINYPTLCHNLVCKELDHLSLPQDITLVNYINGILLIRPSKWEVTTTLDLSERYLHATWWEINPTKIHGLLPQGNFKGVFSLRWKKSLCIKPFL